jgi:hypothetical protein
VRLAGVVRHSMCLRGIVVPEPILMLDVPAGRFASNADVSSRAI